MRDWVAPRPHHRSGIGIRLVSLPCSSSQALNIATAFAITSSPHSPSREFTILYKSLWRDVAIAGHEGSIRLRIHVAKAVLSQQLWHKCRHAPESKHGNPETAWFFGVVIIASLSGRPTKLTVHAVASVPRRVHLLTLLTSAKLQNSARHPETG